jgi:hypothetical protein
MMADSAQAVGVALTDVDFRCHALGVGETPRASSSRPTPDLNWIMVTEVDDADLIHKTCAILNAYGPERVAELKDKLTRSQDAQSTETARRLGLAVTEIATLNTCPSQTATTLALAQEFDKD